MTPLTFSIYVIFTLLSFIFGIFCYFKKELKMIMPIGFLLAFVFSLFLSLNLTLGPGIQDNVGLNVSLNSTYFYSGDNINYIETKGLISNNYQHTDLIENIYFYPIFLIINLGMLVLTILSIVYAYFTPQNDEDEK